jgi:hypothetical protein
MLQPQHQVGKQVRLSMIKEAVLPGSTVGKTRQAAGLN